MEVGMNKLFLFISLSLLYMLNSYAAPIRIPAKGGGLYQVVIVDKGSEGAKYDGTTGSIIHTSHGTKIRIRDIDFGNERYGLYNQFMIEYTHPTSCQDAFFDIYIEDTTIPVASIPVEQTRDGEYKEALASLNVNTVGSHAVYVKWRNHSADLRTFGANELLPFAHVELVRTGSMTKYKFSRGGLEKLTGKHRLKMVWRANTAAVANVYVDKKTSSSILESKEDGLFILSHKAGFTIQSTTPIGKIELYSLAGLKVNEVVTAEYSQLVEAAPGFYILRIIRNNDEISKKILVLE